MLKEESSISIVNTLSIVIVVGYAAAIPMWMWYPPTGVPPEVLAIINQMMGAWGMAFATVVAFHLGSSRSMKDAAAANREAMTTLGSTVAKTADTAATAASTAATAANTAAVVAGATTNGAVEKDAWAAALAADTVAAFTDYLTKFPRGVHAVEAGTRLAAKNNP